LWDHYFTYRKYLLHMKDVVIIGAGPGGLYSGLLLARKGFNVALLEEHENPGEPVHCTGVLAAEAFDEYDIPRDAILNVLTSVCFVSPSGQTVRYSPEKLEAVVIDRKLFDHTLGVTAEQAGVEIRRGQKALSIDTANGHVMIETPTGILRARACILACGASYALQRKLGLGFPTTFLQSAQLELPARSPGHVEMHFGAQVAPRGFAWAVPIKRGAADFVRIGLMCDRNAESYFQEMLQRVGDRWGICTVGKPRLRMLPLAPIPQTYANRLLVIGDAAGLVKPTTGGGIYYSLVSAQIAADVLNDALMRDLLHKEQLLTYETLWKAKLGSELEAQLSLRHLTERLDDTQIESFFELVQTDGILPLVRQSARFNQHRDLILALFKHRAARQILIRRVLG
jgi:digeranylgeranylglycerophospholipid reductase